MRLHLSPRHWLIRVVACLLMAWTGLGLVLAATGDLQAVPPLKARVTDLTNTLPAERKTALEANLREFEATKGVQIAVLIVATTQPEPVEQYALRVAEQWKLGRSKVDDGVLLLVAKDDRRVRIEVGYGVEGVLTDLITQRIISEQATPRFRQGDFTGGIEATVLQMERVISGEALPPPRNARREVGEGAGQVWPLLFVVIVMLGGVLRRVLGRLPGALIVGAVVGGIVWLTMESLSLSTSAGFAGFFLSLLGIDRMVGRHGHSGGFGRGGGWSSGSGGGFRGGGGGFGGGGSSGRW